MYVRLKSCIVLLLIEILSLCEINICYVDEANQSDDILMKMKDRQHNEGESHLGGRRKIYEIQNENMNIVNGLQNDVQKEVTNLQQEVRILSKTLRDSISKVDHELKEKIDSIRKSNDEAIAKVQETLLKRINDNSAQLRTGDKILEQQILELKNSLNGLIKSEVDLMREGIYEKLSSYETMTDEKVSALKKALEKEIETTKRRYEAESRITKSGIIEMREHVKGLDTKFSDVAIESGKDITRLQQQVIDLQRKYNSVVAAPKWPNGNYCVTSLTTTCPNGLSRSNHHHHHHHHKQPPQPPPHPKPVHHHCCK